MRTSRRNNQGRHWGENAGASQKRTRFVDLDKKKDKLLSALEESSNRLNGEE